MRAATWLRRAGWLGAFAITISNAPLAAADEPPQPKVAGEAQAVQERSEPADVLVPRLPHDLINDILPNDFVPYPSKYSIKLGLAIIPRALDAQLQLNGDGALVNSVADGGPADKAGLKVHDVLLAVGDTPIKKIRQLVEAVDKSEGKELSLKVLRAGKPMTITITPESGGYSAEGLLYVTAAQKAAGEAARKVDVEIRQLEEKIREKLKDAGVDVRMQFIQPGRFVPPQFIIDPAEDFPEDLSIHIRKEGRKPAQIEVKQGDKNWTAAEDKLDDLPEDVRKHVKALLGGAPVRFAIAAGGKKFNVPLPAPGEFVAREKAIEFAKEARERAGEARKHVQERLERRLEEMSRQMNQMRERMEDLRRSLREDGEREDKGDKGDKDDNGDKGDDSR